MMLNGYHATSRVTTFRVKGNRFVQLLRWKYDNFQQHRFKNNHREKIHFGWVKQTPQNSVLDVMLEVGVMHAWVQWGGESEIGGRDHNIKAGDVTKALGKQNSNRKTGADVSNTDTMHRSQGIRRSTHTCGESHWTERGGQTWRHGGGRRFWRRLQVEPGEDPCRRARRQVQSLQLRRGRAHRLVRRGWERTKRIIRTLKTQCLKLSCNLVTIDS